MANPSEAAKASVEPSPRRIPKQRRSQEIFESIVAAARLLLEEEAPAALTTNRIAERAGVSIGSLYRYFPNKAAILAEIYDSDASEQASQLATDDWNLEQGPLSDSIRAVVEFQLERHRRLLEMEGEFYRGHQWAFSLSQKLGPDRVEERIRQMLVAHGDRVRVRDVDQAAYLVARGVSAILRLTVRDRPEKLYQDAFREELVDLLLRYVARDAATP